MTGWSDLRKRSAQKSSVWAKCIKAYGAEDFRTFFESHIDLRAHIISDEWPGYSPLKKTYRRLEQTKSNGEARFPQLHTHIMRFKAWLPGVHHHCFEDHVQGYLDEFHFRFNRRSFLDSILDKLLRRMVNGRPLFLTLREVNT